MAETEETAETAAAKTAAETAGTAVAAKTAAGTAGTTVAAKTAVTTGTAAAKTALMDAMAEAAKRKVAAATAWTFTDERDKQTYRAVKMPDGRIWMAQNLNYKPEQGNSWCYGDDESMGGKYGRLYSWRTAMVVSPAGWHLPTHHEWLDLITAKGSYGAGAKLKSKSGWDPHYKEDGNGTDDFRFSALPGGIWDSEGTFVDIGKCGCWWTATEEDSYNAIRMKICNGRELGHDGVDGEKKYKWDGYSVRCVKNG